MPPKSTGTTPKKSTTTTTTPLKKKTTKSTPKGKAGPKGKKPTTNTTPSSQQLDYSNLLALFRSVKHGLPLLPPTTISLIQNTYYEKLFAPITIDPDTNQTALDTGVSLAYLSPELYNPHPFVYRRDFIASQTGKIGGFPSWLVPTHLPSTICPHCTNPMQFLLQFYSPIVYPDESKYENGVNDEKYKKQLKIAESNVHRIIYCFVCTTPNCALQNNSIKIVRCQLPLENRFIAPSKPEYNEKTYSQHNFSYPLDALSTPQQQEEEEKQETPVCILCGGMATICCEQYGQSGIPLYCSELHQTYNTTITKLHSTPFTTTTTSTTIPQSPNTTLPLLESTLLFPRLGFDLDFEVLENDAKVFFKDQNDLQIEEIGTNRSALQDAILEAQQSTQQQQQELDDSTTALIENGLEALNLAVQEPQEVEKKEEETMVTEEPEVIISDDAKVELKQESDLIESALGGINDPKLAEKIKTYVEEEKNKSLVEKFADSQTFSATLDEVDNHSITDQDHVAQNFNTRMELTLPPYITEPFIRDSELQNIERDQEMLTNPIITVHTTNNPLSITNFIKDHHLSKQILRFYNYEYRTNHGLMEPLWAHKLNRLKVHNSADNMSSTYVPELVAKQSPQPTLDHTVPECLKCPNCNGKRLLEAQLTPYLCTYLLDFITKQQLCLQKIASLPSNQQPINDPDSPVIQPTVEISPAGDLVALDQAKQLAEFDFATIAIYTCENSCQDKINSNGYVEEFGYIQPAM